MRVTSWNCLCGDVSDRLSGAGAASRRPDYAAGVPPSGQGQCLGHLARFRYPAASGGGRGQHRGGVGAGVRRDFRAPTQRSSRCWSKPRNRSCSSGSGHTRTTTRWRGRQWEACVAGANGLPVVAAGDFNSSPSVQGQERASQRFLQRMRDELGLVSAYHHCSDESHGEETRASYYHGKKESQPVPHRLLLRARGVGGSSHRGGGRPLRRLVPERSSTAHRGHRHRVAVETDR